MNLSAFAGKKLTDIRLVQESTSPAGTYDIYFDQMAIVSADGTVRPIYNGQTSVAFTPSGTATNQLANVNHCPNCGIYPDNTTWYSHGDQVGSSRLLTVPSPTVANSGYPVWQSTFLPFGYELNPKAGVNAYKFGTYRRGDVAEGLLDYAKFRSYTSQYGRFMTPDPLAGEITNPQSFNRYTYSGNNPLNMFDPTGLEMTLTCMGNAQECLGGGSSYSAGYDAFFNTRTGLDAALWGMANHDSIVATGCNLQGQCFGSATITDSQGHSSTLNNLSNQQIADLFSLRLVVTSDCSIPPADRNITYEVQRRGRFAPGFYVIQQESLASRVTTRVQPFGTNTTYDENSRFSDGIAAGTEQFIWGLRTNSIQTFFVSPMSLPKSPASRFPIVIRDTFGFFGAAGRDYSALGVYISADQVLVNSQPAKRSCR